MNALCYLLDWKCLIYPETVSLMHVHLTFQLSWKSARVDCFPCISTNLNSGSISHQRLLELVAYGFPFSFFCKFNYFDTLLKVRLICFYGAPDSWAFCFSALCSLSIERCSITSRTIQKISDALSAESVLEQLCIGTF